MDRSTLREWGSMLAGLIVLVAMVLGLGSLNTLLATDDPPARPPTEQNVQPVPDPDPAPPFRFEVRTGAVCNDGWVSQATGSGACSWHGGVAYWLTEPIGEEAA